MVGSPLPPIRPTTASGQWWGRATRRVPVGRSLSPLPVQLTVECGLHRSGSGGCCLERGSRMVENRCAPRGDGETKLIKRKGERHPHRLVELLAFALMHDRDDKIVSFDLKLLDRLEILRRMRLAHEVQNTLKKPQAPRAVVLAQVTRDPGQCRAEYRKDQQAVEDCVAIFVEERFLTVVQISERAWMHDCVGILVSRGRFDLDLARHCGGKRLAR